ncbi:glycosyltransferase [Microbacterium thalassium]|uniref:D-inositol 3-phosphate glycosyltransferase n=1 Tax=Microbacterium thalassium TaxID=362649 RepID=A0A7X0FQG5_9MICO|nr:glycosyltransferase [Microbacterium thalassium]MBB6391716.1 hypothetical protein [Microbacterium thalassium]GLK24319.1 hypothetical protein GCM10017607_16370 [Microbacterium thalassium]
MRAPQSQHDTVRIGATRLRIVALADSDSYVKWTAALLGTAKDADIALVLVTTPLTVSATQERTALAGSGLDASHVHRVSYDDLPAWLTDFAPDAVVIGARGPLVRVLAKVAAEVSPRPVIVTGLPGISIPARRAAVMYRAQCDLFIVHSQREIEAFSELAGRLGVHQRFALTRLPFAEHGIGVASTAGTDLVFAAQAIVPREKSERLAVAKLLIDAAESGPRRRVVLKLRSAGGERETHYERHTYPELIEQLGGAPANLVVSYEPMARALDTAEGLVTISSTSAIEAIARGVPVIALDMFGVSDALLNRVFEGSGMLAGPEDVIARWFRHPDPAWLRENYFHEEVFDDWIQVLAELVDERRRGTLTPKSPRRSAGGRLREAWDRKSVLGSEDRSFAGYAALAVGYPVRQAVIWSRPLRGVARERAVRQAEGSGAPADGASELIPS